MIGNMAGWLGKGSIFRRSLSDKEKVGHVKHRSLFPVPLFEQETTICFNSTYMELVDKYYYQRGGIFLLYLCLLAFLVLFFSFIVILPIFYWERYVSEPIPNILFSLICATLTGIPTYFLFRFIYKVDLFSFTHFPIRLNRITRQVYVFKLDGTVAKYHWDNLYFTISVIDVGKSKSRVADIYAFLLDENGDIKDGFSFPYTCELFHDTVEDAVKNYEPLVGHWEYIRRYMEGDYLESYEQVNDLVPIKDKKESIIYGWKRSYRWISRYRYAYAHKKKANATGNHTRDFERDEKTSNFIMYAGDALYYGLFIIFSLMGFGRILAMATSKIPKWPEWVDAENQIDPNDPYDLEKHPKPKLKKANGLTSSDIKINLFRLLMLFIGFGLMYGLSVGIGAIKG